MRKKTPKEKAIDTLIEKLYGIHAAGKSINVMDIGKVFDAGHEAVRTGNSLDEAVKAAVQRLCV